jgi:hypothetical protein
MIVPMIVPRTNFLVSMCSKCGYLTGPNHGLCSGLDWGTKREFHRVSGLILVTGSNLKSNFEDGLESRNNRIPTAELIFLIPKDGEE